MKIPESAFVEGNNQILLSSANSSLVIVDFQEAFVSCFDNEEFVQVESELSQLVGFAKNLKIPIVVTLLQTNLIDAVVSQQLNSSNFLPEVFKRKNANPWNNSDFSSAISESQRPRLIIAGISAETSLSFSVLGALEQGYDVYVITDLCLAASQDSRDITFERLAQAGAVMVTWRQVILEWNQNNVSPQLLHQVFKSSSN